MELSLDAARGLQGIDDVVLVLLLPAVFFAYYGWCTGTHHGSLKHLAHEERSDPRLAGGPPPGRGTGGREDVSKIADL